MPPKNRGGRGGGGGGDGGGGRGGGSQRGGRGGGRGGRGQPQRGGRGGHSQERTVSTSQPARQSPASPSEPHVTASTSAPKVASATGVVPQEPVARPETTPQPQPSMHKTPVSEGAVVDLYPRPGYGTEGRKVTVFANHFRLGNIPQMKIYQYAIVIPTKDGEAPTKGFATAVWESSEFKSALGKHHSSLIFNGRAIAWSTERIHNIPTIEIPRGKDVLRVNFTYATEFSLSDLTAFIKKQAPNSVEVVQCLTFLNQVISQSLLNSSRYMAFGRKYFPTTDDEREISRVDDFSLLEFRRGFYQAIHWGGNSGLMINVNVTTGIFWNSQMHTILDLALRSIGKRADEGLSLSSLNEHQFRLIAHNLRGIKFYIRYRGAQKAKQLHMITSFSKETARGKKFAINGQQTSVSEYFQKTYNIHLRYPDAPLVKKGENFFPMELCHIAPLQRFTKKLDGNQAAAMIKFASKLPDIRKKDTEFKVRALNWQNDPTLKRFGITVNPQMSAVPARILPHPNLSGGADMSGGATFVPSSGKWDLRGYRLKDAKNLKRWGILVLDDQRRYVGPQGVLTRFVQTLCLAANDYGMNIDGNPSVAYSNPNAPQQSIQRACDELCERIKREKGGPPELLMLFIKGRNPITYEILKQYCDTVKGLQSQAIDGFNAQRKGGDRAYHANLLLKINVKLGGTTVVLQTPITTKAIPTMFIGADVSHAAPGSKAPSLATMVGSVDHEGVRYACPLPLNQHSREESISGVRAMVTELANIYKKNTNTYPERVMYFRDGVAEGQFVKVKEVEVAAIKEAIARLSGKAPSVTAIVVRKRNQTRLFPKEGEGDRSSRGNVHPGTVVDMEITHPKDFDFYLVPHSSIQGTARPAHYYVIYDDHNLPADFVQSLCYKMSYVYQRSSGAVSLHPAVYYAHLAGNRARAHDPSRDRDEDSSGSDPLASSMSRVTLDVKVIPLKPIHANIQGSMWWM